MQNVNHHFVYISAFSILSVLCKLLFFAFFVSFLDCCFPVISGFDIYKSTLRYAFMSKPFLNVGEGLPTVASGPLSATFPTLAKTSS